MIIVLDGCVLMPERSNHKIIMKNFVGGGDFVTLSSFRLNFDLPNKRLVMVTQMDERFDF